MSVLVLRKYFLYLVVISTIILSVLIHNDMEFKNNPISQDIQKQIDQKKYQLMKIIKQKYGIYFNVPIIISDKMPNNLFGLAAYTKDKQIQIYLNKKRFQESVEYMVDFVLPHEYAHAMMFKFGNFTKQNGGHTEQWEKICLSLEGKKCDRYVKHDDIIFGKIPF